MAKTASRIKDRDDGIIDPLLPLGLTLQERFYLVASAAREYRSGTETAGGYNIHPYYFLRNQFDFDETTSRISSLS